MKKRIGIILSMLLLTATLVVGLTISASAATTNVATYDQLVSAINSASDGDVINVVADITISSQITVNKNIKLTSTETRYVTCSVANAFNITDGMLTIGGNLDIESTQAIPIYMNGGDFTLEDNAYIHADGVNYIIDMTKAGDIYIKGGKMENTAAEKDKGVIWVGNDGTTFTMTGGEIIQKKSGAYALKIATANNASVTISGGTLKAPDQTVYFYGSQNQNTTFTMTGGKIIATTGDYAIQLNANSKNGKMDISGGHVKAYGSGMATNTGYDIKISGSAIIESETKYAMAWKSGSTGATVEISGNATIKSPAAKVIEVCSGDKYYVKGGTIQTTAEQAFYIEGATSFLIDISGGTVEAKEWTIHTEGVTSGTINVSGGTLRTTNGNRAISLNHTEGNIVNINVTGGIISASYMDAIYVIKANQAVLNISGGTLTAPKGYTLEVAGAGNPVTISGTAEIISGANYTIWTKSDLTISGGTVTGTTSDAIYFTGTNLTFNISGGTISCPDSPVYIVGDCTGSVVNITGGTITATDGAIWFAKDSTGITVNIEGTANVNATESKAIRFRGTSNTLNVKDGTVTAPTQAIYVYEATTNTLNITGGSITTTGTLAIEVVAPSTGTVTISGGNIVAGGEIAIQSRTAELVISGGTIKSGMNTIYLNNDASKLTVTGGTIISGGSSVIALNGTVTINITGGTFLLNGGSAQSEKIIADVGSGSACTVTIDGGAFINNNTMSDSMFDNFGNGTFTLVSGKMLYKNSLPNVLPGVAAPKNSEAIYDLDGDGVLDEGETFYFYTQFASTDAQYAGTMNNGASVRLASKNGLRFTTVYSADIVAALAARGQVTYGTIIVPTTYLVRVNAFTKEALDAAGIQYMEILAYDGIIYNADGTVTIRAAITDVLTENYGLSFSAVCYAYVDGVYYYSAYNTASNARSMEQVALDALEDLSTEKDDVKYVNEVTVNGVKAYSPYTAAQRKILEQYNTTTYGTPILAGVDLTLVRSSDNSYQYYNNNATADNYNDYKALLTENGYTLFAEKVMDGNSFATYTGNGKVLTLSYTPNTTTLVLIVESEEDTDLSATESANAGYATGTEPTVTQLGQWYVDTTTDPQTCYGISTTLGKRVDVATAYTAGMGYVIRLSDGSFIVIDGGYGTDTHAENLYNVLAKQAADPENIVIAAWVFTHAHDDHAGVLAPFTKAYGSKVTVERFIYNFPTDSAAAISGSNVSTSGIKAAMAKYAGAKVTIAHAGQELYIRNAKINVLFTAELMAPHSLNYYNSCSVVFNVVVEGKTLLFFGDAGGDDAHGGSEMAYINKIYTAATLKSDFVQLAHHGVDKDVDSDDFKLYEMYRDKVQAAYVFVPSAYEHVMVDGTRICLEEYNKNYFWSNSFDSANRFLAGSSVLVVTLDNGTVSTESYETVTAYIA